MKVRTTIAGAAPRVRLTVVGWGALAILAFVTVAGCTSASSSSTPGVTSSVTDSGSRSAGADTPSSGASGTDSPSTLPSFTTSPTASPTASPSATYSPPTTASPTVYPSIAPATGGGGTAGFQDALLLGLGAAAIVAGAGGIVYRRRLTRHR